MLDIHDQGRPTLGLTKPIFIFGSRRGVVVLLRVLILSHHRNSLCGTKAVSCGLYQQKFLKFKEKHKRFVNLFKLVYFQTNYRLLATTLSQLHYM